MTGGVSVAKWCGLNANIDSEFERYLNFLVSGGEISVAELLAHSCLEKELRVLQPQLLPKTSEFIVYLAPSRVDYSYRSAAWTPCFASLSREPSELTRLPIIVIRDGSILSYESYGASTNDYYSY